jgi:hypothetical protein
MTTAARTTTDATNSAATSFRLNRIVVDDVAKAHAVDLQVLHDALDVVAGLGEGNARPSHQATNATVVQCDFRCRGGGAMIRRLILPRRQASSFAAISSIWGEAMNSLCGLSS